MSDSNKYLIEELNEDKVLRNILEGTVKETGEKFFEALVENLSKSLNISGAWVTEYLPKNKSLNSLAFWLNGKHVEGYKYLIEGTPCEPVIEQLKCIHIPENVIEIFPNDPDLPKLNAVSYLGTPLLDTDGTILGHLAVLDTRKMPEDPRIMSIFDIFAGRAAAEMRRLRAVQKVKDRELKLSSLIDCAMDAVIELDDELNVTMVNPAAEKVFKCETGKLLEQKFSLFLTNEAEGKFRNLINELNNKPEKQKHLWIPGGLNARCNKGNEFIAEASLSRYIMNRQTFYILILRNINDRLKAEEKIHSLTEEAEYLKEEIKELHNFDEIIGNSNALLRTLKDVERVAATDTTVLILGETGTGKELIARAIHNVSNRKGKPLIKINCAAIPSDLIESELFGHEQGAFTGATKKREGRFKLADEGTIFLDEVGELPVRLQTKLLRILQEKEFEPVGSSKTVKVDVRVIAATNRDLGKEVKQGNFREDLFYRLNVFPVNVPPLREREDDILLLAEKFAYKFAHNLGIKLKPFSPEFIYRIKSYNWPGNVRELQNVIERAVITSTNGLLNLKIALPEVSRSDNENNIKIVELESKKIKTQSEMLLIEKNNIVSALEKTGWRVSGKNGAAELLEVPPTTLSSRIKALGIEKPK